MGINGPQPDATLDVRAKNHLGVVTPTDGILAPRVSSLSVAGSVNGQLVYLTADAGGFIKGFYYWNGTAWTPLGAKTGTVIGYDVLLAGNPIAYPGDNTYKFLDLSIGSGELATWRTNNTTLKVPAGKGGKYLVSYTSGIRVTGTVPTTYSFFTSILVNGNSLGTGVPGTTVAQAAGTYTSAIFSLSWSEIVTLYDGDTLNLNAGTFLASGTPQSFKLARLSLEKIE
ncbi:hypothetical protein DBR28_11810 [Chryseobacterium sp. HMWF028]|nr:hypothetical protein DBR28_11810 [Chryseobacterium sp. HMWF028]